jgi:CheY-like chemotaxis protein
MSSGTVLCIDDDEVGLLVRKMTLEAAGFEVVTATGGRKALELLNDSDFDLVVLDHSMPEMNGGEVAEQIRFRCPGLPIVLLSAYVTLPEEDVQLVDAYITKGDSTETLLAVVGQLIANGRSAKA